jgi:hypothetical protein
MLQCHTLEFESIASRCDLLISDGDDCRNMFPTVSFLMRNTHIFFVFIGEDTERLTDEEANEMLRECRPIYPKVFNPRKGIGEFQQNILHMDLSRTIIS